MPSTPPSRPVDRPLPTSSRLILGCMGMGSDWNGGAVTESHIAQAHAALEAALEIGITLFDHADIYKRGTAEQCFGELLRRQASLRDSILLQSKCGIRFADDSGPARYDLSGAYIVSAAEASLRRLGVEHLDILLLHRPDPLMEPHEIAEAFSRLRSAGKVRFFGVSNMQAGQMRWLQQALDAPLVANQLEMSLAKLDWLDHDSSFNDAQNATALPWADTLQYCQQQGIQLQAWSPLAQGAFSGAKSDSASPAQQATAKLVLSMAEQYAVSAESIVLAWLLRHPAGIQAVIGSTNPDRIRACAAATTIQMSREDWYRLYLSARGQALP
ncbi:aldo/keto reductase [Paucibacter sp. hw8]|uniref:Aldo/keto reductase n=1 Tax=Roseateles albus TaxID=2987525 RepID=A0ABT5KD46_9BURK|nr:aldo/keto reductase [Roseateles albus]